MALDERLDLNPSERGRMGQSEIKVKSKRDQLMEDRHIKWGLIPRVYEGVRRSKLGRFSLGATATNSVLKYLFAR